MNFFRSKPKTQEEIYQEKLSKYKSTKFVVAKMIIDKYLKLGTDTTKITTYFNAMSKTLQYEEIEIEIEILTPFIKNNDFDEEDNIRNYKRYAEIILPLLQSNLQLKEELKKTTQTTGTGGRKSRKGKRKNRKSRKYRR